MSPSLRALAVSLLLLAAAAPARAQWEVVEPGGDTACSDGSPFRFFVHPGDPGKLLVEFEGGGACWNDETCASAIYTRRIATDPEQARRLGLLVGMYDRSNPRNPFRDWTHVYIPYCTGDLHWGNAVRTYQGPAGPYTVHHRGAANASVALAWVSENVPPPSQLFVTGCSAGGYGAILWAPRLMARYPAATAAHLSDSAAGVVPPGFFAVPLANWDPSAAWPSEIPGLDLGSLDAARFTLADFYTAVATHHPGAAFGQFNALADSTQVFFYGLTGGSPVASEWSAGMVSSVEAIKGANPNFFAYLAPGAQHCIINAPSFYTTTVGGTSFVDWIARLAGGGRPGHVP
ncbi:MAG TPA: pectin acetylesterase-family hydrolase [Vicinamibacteria bacterium]|nr:pectin acetylesterase-family hydrolase [Vicinamibacteria bacterium]